MPDSNNPKDPNPCTAVVVHLSTIVAGLHAEVVELRKQNDNQKNAIELQSAQMTGLLKDLDQWTERYQVIEKKYDEDAEKDRTINQLRIQIARAEFYLGNRVSYLQHTSRINRKQLIENLQRIRDDCLKL